jgi:hypothetical protein
MKTFIKILIITVSLSFIFTNCTPEASSQSCQSYTGTSTESVSGPTSTTINVPIQLDVVFVVFNTCGFFDQFFEETIDGIKYITVNAVYDGCECEDVVLLKPVTYNFVAATAGTYVLRFKISNTTYVEHTIEVTD